MSTLAIVIPYYKLSYFEETLQSLAAQTNKDFSVYIGNDNSPEDPINLINKYSSIITKYVKFDSNLGSTYLTKQWDRCIDLTQGEEWIMLLGDDDYLDGSFIENFNKELDYFIQKKIVLVRGNVIEINHNGSEIRRCFFPKRELPSKAYIKKIKDNYHISLPEFLFKKDEYLKNRFKHFPYAYGSDNVAWLEFSKRNYIYTLNSIVYIRSSEKSISGNNLDIRGKVYGMHLTKKYILKNINYLFTKEELDFIAIKGYKELCFSRKNNLFIKIVYIVYCKMKFNINVFKSL